MTVGTVNTVSFSVMTVVASFGSSISSLRARNFPSIGVVVAKHRSALYGANLSSILTLPSPGTLIRTGIGADVCVRFVYWIGSWVMIRSMRSLVAVQFLSVHSFWR